MLNFILICCLFVFVIILFAELSGIKSRLRIIENLLAQKLISKNQENVDIKTTETLFSMTDTTSVKLDNTKSDISLKTPPELTSTITTQHGFFNSLFHSIYIFFTGDNSFVRVGMLVLFFGIAFLLKYAAQIGYFPIEVRLFSVAIIALTLFVVGFLLEKKRFIYAITLEGGSFAILFLLCFASYYHYHLLNTDITFGILASIATLTILWAIKQNMKSLAIIGIIGGFATPLLINTNIQNITTLFGYYFILNVGIFITAWFRNWRELNILGFIFTFVITSLWYWHGYSEHDKLIAQFFLFTFFAFYLIVALLTAIKQPPNLKGFIESSLVFALPAVTFALQAFLLNYASFPLAITAISLAVLYSLLSLSLYYFFGKTLSTLAYAFAAIALVFFTLSIPLLLSGESTSAIWTLEATALIWVGIKQQRYLIRLGGMIIGILANFYFFIEYPNLNYASWFNNEILNNLLLTVTNLLSSYFLFSSALKIKPYEKAISKLFFALGSLWWLIMIYHAAIFYFPANYQPIGFLLLISVSALLALIIEKICCCNWYNVISFSLLPFMILLAINEHYFHPLTDSAQWIMWYWCFGFLTWYSILWNYRKSNLPYLKFGHIGSYILVTWLISSYITQSLLHSNGYSETWIECVWIVIPSLMLLIIHIMLKFIKQFFSYFFLSYSEILSIGFIVYSLFLVLSSNLQSEGIATPWHYLLLLNPLDLSSIIALVIVTLRCFAGEFSLVKANNFKVAVPCYIIGCITFIWANAAILRFLHFNYGVPFNIEGFVNSQLAQAVLSIFWGLIALITTILANQKQWRPIWFVGAVMIAITILKLFIFDLSNFGTIERIIAFISVGIILLLIGYFAPLPPKENK